MRFYTQQHPFYCGIDLHARTMYICILSQDGEVVLHRNMKAAPEPFLKAIAPSADDDLFAFINRFEDVFDTLVKGYVGEHGYLVVHPLYGTFTMPR